MKKLFNNRQNKGITLIALVVTIIVLLILAGTSINMIVGDNSIIGSTKKAKKAYDTASIIERIQLEIIGSQNKSGFLNASDISSNIKKSINGVEIEGNENAFPIILSISDEHYIIYADGNIKKVDGSLTSAEFPTASNLKGIVKQFINVEKFTELNPDIMSLAQQHPENTSEILSILDSAEGGCVESFKQFTGTEEEAKEKGIEIQTGESEGKIYMWFEPSNGNQAEVFSWLTFVLRHNIIVETGTLYWWSDADLVFLNEDCNSMFSEYQNLKDIDGLRNLIASNVVNMDSMFYRMYISS